MRAYYGAIGSVLEKMGLRTWRQQCRDWKEPIVIHRPGESGIG